MEAFVDADWAGDKGNRNYTTGFIINFNNTPVFWRSKKQTIVALSSGEAEYVAISTCDKDLLWNRRMFWELNNLRVYNEHSVSPYIKIMLKTRRRLKLLKVSKCPRKANTLRSNSIMLSLWSTEGMCKFRIYPLSFKLLTFSQSQSTFEHWRAICAR